MNGIERYVDLNGLKERKRPVVTQEPNRIVVVHDDIEVQGKGIVQRLIEKYGE